jgi:hypothetical protein
LTRWKSSSRTGSRRSRPGRLLPALAALLALAGPPAAAQALSLAVQRDDLVVGADAFFRWDKGGELAAALREGLESRITFTLRVFETAPGLRGLLGDRLLAERTVTRSAYYNFLDTDFVVEDSGGARLSFTALEDALEAFFTVRAGALLILRPGQAGRCYAAAQARFDPVRLMPPLTIVSLAGAGGRVTTPWVRAEIPR